MASYVPCKKNDSNGYIFYVSLVSQADTKVMQANPTLAAGDVKIAVDDAAPGNLGTLPVADADFTKRVKVTLSQAETNGDNLTIIFSDASGAEWCDLTINIQTSAQTLDTVDTDVTAVKTQTDKLAFTVANKVDANVYTWNGTAVSTPSTAGIPEVNVKNIANAAVSVTTAQIGANLVNIAGSAVNVASAQLGVNAVNIAGATAAQYGATEKAAIDLLDDANGLVNIHDTVDLVKAQTDLIPADITAQLDTNVPAIKAKTDLLPADTATQLDTNIPAIKAKTDLIPADIATQLDTNIPAILADTGTDGVVIPQAQADKVWGTTIRALTDKAGFTISGTKTTLDALNDISAVQVNAEVDTALSDYDPPTRAELTTDKNSIITEIDDLVTRVKGLDAIYDSVALRALEATLTAIKGAGWTAETLKAIKDAIDALVTGGATAQEVWEYVTRTLTATPESFVV